MITCHFDCDMAFHHLCNGDFQSIQHFGQFPLPLRERVRVRVRKCMRLKNGAAAVVRLTPAFSPLGREGMVSLWSVLPSPSKGEGQAAVCAAVRQRAASAVYSAIRDCMSSLTDMMVSTR